MRGRLRPEAMFPADVPGVRTRRVKLAGDLEVRLAECGDLDAPPVLLLHGWGASLYMWRAWFAPLAAAGLRAIAVDLPGHGLSGKPDHDDAYSLERMCATVSELLEAERLTSVDILAQSMAGTIALEIALAADSRVKRLVLINPACFGRIRLQALGRAVSPPAVDTLLPRLVTRWVVSRAHRMVYGDPSLISERDEDEYWAPSQFPAYARAMRRLLHVFPWTRPPVARMTERLRGLPRRALVVLGTRDRLVRDSRDYVSRLRSAGAPILVHEVEGGGHAVNEERPAEIVSLVLLFLKAAETEPGQHRAT